MLYEVKPTDQQSFMSLMTTDRSYQPSFPTRVSQLVIQNSHIPTTKSTSSQTNPKANSNHRGPGIKSATFVFQNHEDIVSPSCVRPLVWATSLVLSSPQPISPLIVPHEGWSPSRLSPVPSRQPISSGRRTNPLYNAWEDPVTVADLQLLIVLPQLSALCL